MDGRTDLGGVSGAVRHLPRFSPNGARVPNGRRAHQRVGLRSLLPSSACCGSGIARQARPLPRLIFSAAFRWPSSAGMGSRQCRSAISSRHHRGDSFAPHPSSGSSHSSRHHATSGTRTSTTVGRDSRPRTLPRHFGRFRLPLFRLQPPQVNSTETPNKARLDNRWGFLLFSMFHSNFKITCAIEAHPHPSDASA